MSLSFMYVLLSSFRVCLSWKSLFLFVCFFRRALLHRIFLADSFFFSFRAFNVFSLLSWPVRFQLQSMPLIYQSFPYRWLDASLLLVLKFFVFLLLLLLFSGRLAIMSLTEDLLLLEFYGLHGPGCPYVFQVFGSYLME